MMRQQRSLRLFRKTKLHLVGNTSLAENFSASCNNKDIECTIIALFDTLAGLVKYATFTAM